MPKPFSRLPTNVIPSHYTISLKPDLVAHTFEGIAEVKVDVKEAVKTIVCNANELAIHAATVTSGASVLSTSVDLDKENETVTLKLSEELGPGPSVVTYKFTGILNDKMRGFIGLSTQLMEKKDMLLLPNSKLPMQSKLFHVGTNQLSRQHSTWLSLDLRTELSCPICLRLKVRKTPQILSVKLSSLLPLQ